MKFCGECGTATNFAPDEHRSNHHYCPACGWRWYSPPTMREGSTSWWLVRTYMAEVAAPKAPTTPSSSVLLS